MTPENIHDEKVIPALREAVMTARDNGGSAVCFTDWVSEDGTQGWSKTIWLSEDAGIQPKLLRMMIDSNFSIDNFMIECRKSHLNGEIDFSNTLFGRLLDFGKFGSAK